jgi:transcriptional regulator with XRE-family HTH domain
MTTLEDLLQKRPGNRAVIEAHKRRMLDAMHAYQLRELRQAAGMKKKQMAERLQVSQNRVSRIERGDLERVQVDTLRRYVAAFGGTLHIDAEVNGERIKIA